MADVRRRQAELVDRKLPVRPGYGALRPPPDRQDVQRLLLHEIQADDRHRRGEGAMMTIRNLRRDEDGAGAVEFALVAPALLGFIIGLTQLGMLFFANADLHNAVAAGARLAMIWPRPTDDQIKQRIVSMLPKLDQSKLSAATVTHGTD